MYFFDNDFLHDSSRRARRGLRQGLQLRAVREPRLRDVPAGVMQVLYTTVPDHTPLIVVDS